MLGATTVLLVWLAQATPPPPPACMQPKMSEEGVTQLKAMLNGLSGWKRQDNWGTGDPCMDKWYGLVCTCPGGVKNELVGMQLNDNNLNGVLPAELFKYFESITKIDLSGNMLTGPLPFINVNNNPKLEFLYLQQKGTTFTGDLDGLLSIPALQELNLIGNEGITGTIPTAVGTNCPYLSLLLLSNTKLTGSVPESLWSMTKLTHLDLSGLGLTGSIAPTVASLQDIFILNLNGNSMEGNIPEFHPSAFTAPESSVYIVGNKFQSIPQQFFAYGVTELQASNNEISGEIPSIVRNASNLQHLYLDGNRLGGDVPVGICGCKLLQILKLNGNEFTGLPSCLGQGMTSMSALMLFDNNLGGSLPSTSLCEMTNLEQLQVQNNLNLEGIIDPCVKAWKKLTTFIVDRTSMSGTIPDEIFASNSLTTLIVSQSKFGGTIPDLFASTPALETITIQSTHVGNTVVEPYLTGVIPESIFGLKSLTSLTLQFNRLQGTVPDKFGEMPKLNQLLLNNNLLTGAFPMSLISHLKTAPQDATPRIVMLDYNYLTGTVPDCAGITQVEKFVINHNRLTGYIPPVFNKTHAWLNNSGGDSSIRYQTFFAGMLLLPPVPAVYQDMGAYSYPFLMNGGLTVDGEDKIIVNSKATEVIRVATSYTRESPSYSQAPYGLQGALCNDAAIGKCTGEKWKLVALEHPIYQDAFLPQYLSSVNLTIPAADMTLGVNYFKVMFRGVDFTNGAEEVTNSISGGISPHIIVYDPNPELVDAQPTEGRKWGCQDVDLTGGPFINTGAGYLKCRLTQSSTGLYYDTPVTYHNETWITCNIPESAAGYPLDHFFLQVTPNNGSTFSVGEHLHFTFADDCPVSPAITSLPKGQNCSCGMCECSSAGLCFYNATAQDMQCLCDDGFEGDNCDICVHVCSFF